VCSCGFGARPALPSAALALRRCLAIRALGDAQHSAAAELSDGRSVLCDWWLSGARVSLALEPHPNALYPLCYAFSFSHLLCCVVMYVLARLSSRLLFIPRSDPPQHQHSPQHWLSCDIGVTTSRGGYGACIHGVIGVMISRGESAYFPGYGARTCGNYKYFKLNKNIFSFRQMSMPSAITRRCRAIRCGRLDHAVIATMLTMSMPFRSLRV
jgi:hypothetical protein